MTFHLLASQKTDWPPDPEIENAAPTAIGSGDHSEAPLKGPDLEYADEELGAININSVLNFGYLFDLFDELSSISISGREASRRGSLALTEGHFQQIVIVGKEIRQIFGSLKSGVPL
jgi:hypothetical protein